MKSISLSLSWIAKQLIEMTVCFKKNQKHQKTTQEKKPTQITLNTHNVNNEKKSSPHPYCPSQTLSAHTIQLVRDDF